MEELQLPTIPCTTLLQVTAVNNQPIGRGYLTHQTKLLTLQTGLFHHVEIAFYVISSPSNFIILGFPWLQRHDSQISWKEGELKCWSSHCLDTCFLNAVPRPCLATLVESPSTTVASTIPREYLDFHKVFRKEFSATTKPRSLGKCPRLPPEGHMMTTDTGKLS